MPQNVVNINSKIRYKFISFLIKFKNEILQAVKCHFYDCNNNIYKFIKPFVDNKMSILEEYGALKRSQHLGFITLLYQVDNH